MDAFERTLLRVADELERSKDDLNRLDAVAGDGDLGITATLIAKSVRGAVEMADGATAEALLQDCAREIARTAPSSCGTLLATALLRAGRASQPEDAPVQRLADGLVAAVDGIASRGKVSVGDRTMLDALAPASDAAGHALAQGASIPDALEATAVAAEQGAQATRHLEAKVGRAGWLRERAAGHVDAGAHLVAVILRACATTEP